MAVMFALILASAYLVFQVRATGYEKYPQCDPHLIQTIQQDYGGVIVTPENMVQTKILQVCATTFRTPVLSNCSGTGSLVNLAHSDEDDLGVITVLAQYQCGCGPKQNTVYFIEKNELAIWELNRRFSQDYVFELRNGCLLALGCSDDGNRVGIIRTTACSNDYYEKCKGDAKKVADAANAGEVIQLRSDNSHCT